MIDHPICLAKIDFCNTKVDVFKVVFRLFDIDDDFRKAIEADTIFDVALNA